MYKKLLLLGAVSGLLSAVASIIYQKVYAASLGENFALIVKPLNIIVINVVSGLIAATGFCKHRSCVRLSPSGNH
jgi:hypothetical protein